MNYTRKTWAIDGSHIVAVENNDFNNSETICDFAPATEYPTVNERSNLESLNNALLIIKAPKMYEGILEILHEIEKPGIINEKWIQQQLEKLVE